MENDVIEDIRPYHTTLSGSIKVNLGFELKSKISNLFRMVFSVTLATKPWNTTPDLAIYPHQALDFKNYPARRKDAPLLVIEIESASQSTKEMVEKFEPYFDFGVKSCWIVIPTLQAILVYDSPSHYEFYHEDEILKDKTLNIEIDLKKVFK